MQYFLISWTISHQIYHCVAAAAQRHFLSVNLQNFARGIGCACWHLHLDLGERCSKAVGIPAAARRGVGPACGPAAGCRRLPMPPLAHYTAQPGGRAAWYASPFGASWSHLPQPLFPRDASWSYGSRHVKKKKTTRWILSNLQHLTFDRGRGYIPLVNLNLDCFWTTEIEVGFLYPLLNNLKAVQWSVHLEKQTPSSKQSKSKRRWFITVLVYYWFSATWIL